jgi:hypothetical protein
MDAVAAASGTRAICASGGARSISHAGAGVA